MNRKQAAALVAGAALAALGVVGQVYGDNQGRSLKATLRGFAEVPAVSSTGSGEFRAKISRDESVIEFELTYAELEGATTTAAHIHLGQAGVNGGVSVFLCGGGGRPDCMPTSGTFGGLITADNVIGPAGQGIAAGEFAELLAALRARATYVNVHTDKHPGGEIRGQIK